MTETLSEHNMMTVQDLEELLSATEDLEERPFEYGGDTKVWVDYRPDVPGLLFFVFGERTLDEETGEMVADEYPLTRDSAEQLFKQVKMPPKLLDEVPLDLTVPVLNWFLENQKGVLKAIITKSVGGVQKISAFCRAATEIYSSVDMLNTILSTLRNKYGVTDVLVNNVTHDLQLTNYTLLFPETGKQIEQTGEVLLSGINVQTSVLGLKPLVMHGVTARDYHFNGMLSTTAIVQWNRKQARTADLDDIMGSGEGESYDVFDWIEEQVVALHQLRNNDIVNVERLTGLSLAGHSAEFLNDVFNKFSIPAGVQNIIRMEFAESEEPTIFSLWNAITATANDDEVQEKPPLVHKLMLVGGEIAHHPSSCPSCHRLSELDD